MWYKKFGITRPFYGDEWVCQIEGDCLIKLPQLPAESIDLIATDPPYGIGFMGKDWDRALPDKRVWIECLRVLKPGAFAFVMSIPRADCLSRMIISLEDAGFWVNFTPIFHAFASGFPKAQNIGKTVDKRAGRIATPIEIIKDKLAELYGLSGKPLSQIDRECGFRASGYLRKTHRDDDGWGEAVPTLEKWVVISKVIGCVDVLSKQLAEFFKEAEREITGKGRAGFLERNKVFELNKEGYGDYNITKPAIAQAKALDGSYGGFQPKPSVEIVIVAMKPLSEKTFVDQALKNKKGITWLDEGRIPYQSDMDKASAVPQGRITTKSSKSGVGAVVGGINDMELDREKWIKERQLGRFPANLLVSDDVLNDGKDYKTGDLNRRGDSRYWGLNGQDLNHKGSSGSFSRYFDLDAWFAERIKELPVSVQKTFPFLIVPKASKSEKDEGLGSFPKVALDTRTDIGKGSMVEKGLQPGRNIHPTVKPLKLMSYLITLGSRAGDVVVDPYVGSGTTAIASKILSRKCIGIEIKPDYSRINELRTAQPVQPFLI